MRVKNRIVAIVLACVVVSQCVYADEVRAEFVSGSLVIGGVVITTETALAVALSLFGFSATATAVYKNRDDLIDFCSDLTDEFNNYCRDVPKYVDISTRNIEDWCAKIANGVLDKADSCYDAFRDFLSHKALDGSASDGSATIEIDSEAVQTFFKNHYRNMEASKKYTTDSVDVTYTKDFFTTFAQWDYDNGIRTEPHVASYDSENSALCVLKLNYERGGTSYYDYIVYLVSKSKELDAEKSHIRFYDNCYNHTGFYSLGSQFYDYDFSAMPISASGGNTGAFSSWYQEGKGLGLPGEVDMSLIRTGELPTFEVDMGDVGGMFDMVNRPYWLSSDKMYSFLSYIIYGCFHHLGWGLEGIYEDGKAVDLDVSPETQRVLDRDKSLENVDVVSPTDVAVQEVPLDLGRVKDTTDLAEPFVDVQTKTIDTTVEKTIDDDTPIENVISSVKSDENFSIRGLERVFPFCIPYDVYHLYSCLSAKGQAPKFNWKFPFYKNGKISYTEIEIDLSVFDSVARILRTVELLAFCVFLSMKTKDLIKW